MKFKKLPTMMANIISLLVCASTFVAPFVMADSEIYVIRHGEKPAAGLGQLSCKGFNRAMALSTLWPKRYGKPDVVIVPNPGVQKKDKGIEYAYIRPLATVEPLAILLAMPVEASVGFNDLGALHKRLEKILNNPQEHKVLVAWEHKIAEQVVRDFLTAHNVKATVPHWEDDDFDSIYILSQKAQEPIQFRIEKQGLNGLTDQCPAP